MYRIIYAIQAMCVRVGGGWWILFAIFHDWFANFWKDSHIDLAREYTFIHYRYYYYEFEWCVNDELLYTKTELESAYVRGRKWCATIVTSHIIWIYKSMYHTILYHRSNVYEQKDMYIFNMIRTMRKLLSRSILLEFRKWHVILLRTLLQHRQQPEKKRKSVNKMKWNGKTKWNRKLWAEANIKWICRTFCLKAHWFYNAFFLYMWILCRLCQ